MRTRGEGDVLLVSMPFAPLDTPSLGLTVVQGALAARGLRCEILYLTFPFAREIGADLYADIAGGKPITTDLLGEWLFSSAVAPSDAQADELYVDEVLRGSPPAAIRRAAGMPGFIQRALGARPSVEPFLARALREIPWGRYRIVGFTTVFQQNMASLALAKRIKAIHPGVEIVFGGANAESVMGQELLRSFPFVDAVVSGEGERSFPEYAARRLAGRAADDVPGVFTRANLEAPPPQPPFVELDASPRSDFDSYFEQLKAAGLDGPVEPRLLFESSRGCWWGERSHCTFCGLNGSGMAFRAKSQKRALDELRDLVARYPGRKISVVDNILDMAYFSEFIPAVRDSGIDVDLFYEVKANLQRKHLEALREARIRSVQPGIESLSTAVLKAMRKGTTLLQNVQLLKWCKELGIHPYWNIIWGFPSEPPAEYERMAERVPRLVHLPPPGAAAPLRIDRFSPNFSRSEELGFRDVKPYPAYSHVYRSVSEPGRQSLAYYFTGGYSDGRNPDDYVGPLARAVADWRQNHHERELLSWSSNDYLILWDQRGTRGADVWVLTDAAREAYLACDQARGGSALGPQAAPALRLLVERGLMLEDGGSYLSLAVPLGPYRPAKAVQDAIAAAFREENSLEQSLVEEAPGVYRSGA